MSRTPRSLTFRILATAATAAASAGLVFAAGTPAALASNPEHLHLSWQASSILTLPSTDGFNDNIVLEVKSTTSDPATETIKRLSSGGATLLTSPVNVGLSEVSATDWEGTVNLSDSSLTAGSYESIVTDNGVKSTIGFTIGSGIAKSVKITTDRGSYFTNSTIAPYEISTTVGIKDETGTYLPIDGGHIVFTDPHHRTTNEPLNSSSGTPPKSTGNVLDINGLPTGTASLKAVGMIGPTASTKTAFSSTMHVTLKLAKLESISLKPAHSTIYTALNGYHSTQSFTFSSTVNTPNAIQVSGAITLKKGSETVMTWPISDSSPATEVTWNGLDGSDHFPGDGTYTVSASATVPGSNTLKETTHFVVSGANWKVKYLTITKPASDFFPEVTGAGGTCSYQKHESRVCTTLPLTGTYDYLIGGTSASGGGISAPSSVLKYASYAGYAAVFTVSVSHLTAPTSGDAFFTWGSDGTFGEKTILDEGKTFVSGGFSSTDTKIGGQLTLEEGAGATVKTVTVEFAYAELP